MRVFIGIVCAVLLAAGAAAANSYHSMYARLGGYAGVSSISNDLVARLAADPKLAAYFARVSTNERAQLAKYAADYACKEAGAGCHPVTPNVSLVTSTPALTRAQKDAAVSDLKQTLDAHRVPADIRFTILQSVR
jgi:truncated hemoglobin YjbI